MINQVLFQDVQTQWNSILSQNAIKVPFFTWEWHNDWFHSLGTTYEPLCFVIDNTTIASFAKQGTTLLFAGGDEIADYLDIIGPDDNKIRAWQQLIPLIQSLGITTLILRNIPEDSSTRTYFINQPNTTVEKEDTTPQFMLPATWEIYVESLSKKYRHELERKIRKFNREHPDSEIVESANPREDIHILFDLMEKDEAKKIFLTTEMKSFFTTIAATFSTQTSLRFITLGDKKIAATISFFMDNSYYLYNSGFDKDCCSIAGFFLKAMNIKHAIEQHANTYNFLQGKERYKYELGAVDFGVYKISCTL